MLNTQPNMVSYDDFYETLLTAHQGLDTAQSHAMNVRLVLLLSNHIGDMSVLQEALRIARGQSFATETASLAGRAVITNVTPTHASA